MKLVFISDTHGKHDQVTVPECDILFHTGDWTGLGHKHEVEDFAKWLNKQTQCKHIVVIPGNHEEKFEKCLLGSDKDPSSKTWFLDHCPRVHLLIHESLELEGLKIFGSPWTPYFFNWAWNAGRTITEASHTFKPFIGDLWKDIPNDTQILLTHGPCAGVLDDALDYGTGRIEHVGCSELSKKMRDLKDLRIHAFGHLHLNGGKIVVDEDKMYINSAICDDSYRAHDHRKVIIDI